MNASPSSVAQRVEARADQLVAGEAQAEHLAALGGASGDDERVVGRQVRGRRSRALPTANGIDGWLSTGATMMSSTIIASANPPLKHMPDRARRRGRRRPGAGCGRARAGSR